MYEIIEIPTWFYYLLITQSLGSALYFGASLIKDVVKQINP